MTDPLATAIDTDRAAWAGRAPVRIRTARPEDADAIGMLVAQLNAERSRTRYHADALVPKADEVGDGNGSGRKVVAVTPGGSGDRVVGLASWAPGEDGQGQAMLAVAEGWRLTDIGQRLLAEVGHRAVGHGIQRFVAEIVPRNAALRAAARALGLPEHRTGVSVEIDVTRLA